MARRKDEIRLSRKHGVNPSLGVCWFCQQESGEIILPGHLPGDAEAPRKGVWHKLPCPKCVDLMAQGVILISVKATDILEEQQNPYRTGGWCVVKDEAIKRWPLDQEMKDAMLKHRVAWLEDEMWDHIGLPRGEEIDNRKDTP